MQKYSDIPQSQTIVEILKRKNIHRAVISSGSRCAPLTIGLSRSEIECFSVIDERSAAFFALGMAKQSQAPVAIVCTSGTAVLNYYPAVAEAFYSRVPLIVISADRPQHMVDQGAGQTIRQNGVLSQHCVYSTCLREGSSPETLLYNAKEISSAIDSAIYQSAPVHINVPFSEPLYGVTDNLFDIPLVELTTNNEVANFSLDEFQIIWHSSQKKMILIGCSAYDSDFDATLGRLAEQNDLIVLCESTSNIHHPLFVNKIDQVIIPLSEKELEHISPDLLITMGGEIVSKKIKVFLSKYKPKQHIHISEYTAPNTFGALTQHIRLSGNVFLKQITHLSTQEKKYSSIWHGIKSLRSVNHSAFVAPYSDLFVWKKINEYIPDNQHLEISNSAGIRYSQFFDFNNTISCNRGTSGIDGSTSTAVGISVASSKPVTFVSGDLSFFYDSNALWNKYIPSTLRIIVINNAGGGIFKILPDSSQIEECEEFLQATHKLTAEHLATMHHFEYSSAKNEHELHKQLSVFWHSSQHPKILEIFTPSELNHKVLKDYWNFL